MRKLIVLSLACVLVSTCTASSPPPAQTQAAAQPDTGARKPPRACEIVTPAEIAQALGVPEVTKDDVNSGENVMTHVDICNWYVRTGSADGVQVQVFPAQGADAGASLVAYSSAKGEAVGHDSARAANAQQLTGIGEEAIYSPYPVGNGGNIALRVQTGAVTITGSAARDRLETIARLAASRM
jgi:hypothetical protein